MQVPTLSVPQTSIGQPNTVFQTGAGASPDAFGAGLGQALDNAGNTAAKIALDWQGLENEAAARNLSTETEVKLAARSAEFGTLKGQDAINGASQYAKDLNKIRQDSIASTNNPAVGRLVDQQVARTLAYHISDGFRHVKTETLNYNKQTLAGSVAMAQNTAIGSDNPDQVNENIERVKQDVTKQAAADGLEASNPQTQDRIAQAVGGIHAKKLFQPLKQT